MLDVGQLLPHGKKDAKLDTKSERGVINEVGRGEGGGSRHGRRCWGDPALRLAAALVATRWWGLVGAPRRGARAEPHTAAPRCLPTAPHLLPQVADMKGCTSVLYFEARKHKDL